MRLAEIRGHDRLRAVLARALERDRLPPAMLFAGPEGVGKKTLALAVAQATLCEAAPAPEPCGACRACRRVAASTRPERLAELRQDADRHPDEDVWRNFRLHPDLVLAEGWWLTRTGRPRSEPEIRVDQARDLVSEIAGAPFEARRRVYAVVAVLFFCVILGIRAENRRQDERVARLWRAVDRLLKSLK